MKWVFKLFCISVFMLLIFKCNFYLYREIVEQYKNVPYAFYPDSLIASIFL